MSYFEHFQALADLCLEESWVLEVAPFQGGAAFRIEAALEAFAAVARGDAAAIVAGPGGFNRIALGFVGRFFFLCGR